MKKAVIFAVALVASLSVFAEGTEGVAVSGYVRAGISSTLEENSALSTKTWFGGTYFNGGSKTRGRINLAFTGTSDVGSYGAFLRLQYTGKNDSAAASWGYGDVSYANAYAGFFNNVLTVEAGKIKDVWIGSSGFSGFSVLDGKSGAAITFSPITRLAITGAAVIDYSSTTSNTYQVSSDTFLGGVKYTNDSITLDAAYAGYGLITANVSFNGLQNVLIEAEAAIDTDHGLSILADQRAQSDIHIRYTGVDKWTFALLSYQYFDKVSISADNDFTFTITPAISYRLNTVFQFLLEGTYTQSVYEGAPNSYTVIEPAVRLYADKSASATLWTSISTDTAQEKSSVGIGVIKTF